MRIAKACCNPPGHSFVQTPINPYVWILTIPFLGGVDEVCKKHGATDRHAVVPTVSRAYPSLCVATPGDDRNLPCNCGGELGSDKAGCVSIVCQLRPHDRHLHRGVPCV